MIPAPTRYRLTLTDTRQGEAIEARLRRLLKAMLRAYGFRAGGVERLPAEDEQERTDDHGEESKG